MIGAALGAALGAAVAALRRDRTQRVADALAFANQRTGLFGLARCTYCGTRHDYPARLSGARGVDALACPGCGLVGSVLERAP